MRQDPSGLYATDGFQWCGPTAIAALTGIPASKVELEVIEHRRNNPPPRINRKKRGQLVKSMWASEIIPVFARLGFTAALADDYAGEYTSKVEAYNAKIRACKAACDYQAAMRVPRPRKGGDMPTFRHWRWTHAKGKYLVLISGHLIAYSDGMIVDTMTGRKPVPASNFKNQSTKVLFTWKVL